MPVIEARAATDFVDSAGVCVHLEETTTPYDNEALVAREMLYLGMHNARVIAPAVNTAAYISLGQLGIKFDVIVSNTALSSQLAFIDEVAPYVSSIEGPDELDAMPISYDGLTGVPAAVAYQEAMFLAVRADPALANVSVLPFSLAQSGNSSNYGDLSAYADYGNIHAYGSDGVPPDFWMAWVLQHTTTPSRPTIITETGMNTDLSNASGVSQDVQAKWLVDTLLDAFKAGVSQTYIYQLMDPDVDLSNTNYEMHWGLFNSDGTPKLAASAIHNMMSILADNGAAANTFAPGTLNYTIGGLPNIWDHSQLLEKSDGAFDLELWQEPVLWNPTTKTENVVPPATVTLAFANVMYEVQIFDPLVGTSAIMTYSYITTLTLSLGTDALIVEITPSGTPSAPVVVPPAPTITGLSQATDTGASVTDSVTSDTTPILLGTALPGVLVTIYDGATVLGTAVAASNGVWAFSVLSPLAQGLHALNAVATTSAGNSPASSISVTIDSVAPVISSITASLSSESAIHPGQTVTFTLNLSEPILLSTTGGSPLLTLSTGGTATFDAADSTAAVLVFNALITGGQSAANLQVVALSLNGAVATDLAGNTLTAGSMTTTQGSGSGITVDPTALPVTLGSGSSSIIVGISELGWNGDAQFTISVDGTQIGGIQTATAIHGSGQSQLYTLNGNFGDGSHVVAVAFVNPAGTTTNMRTLFVDSITASGTTNTLTGSLLFHTTLTYNSPLLWSTSSPVSLGAGPNSIVVNISENAWKGDAQFTISVDGTQIGGTQTATAALAAGQAQAFTLNGSFGPGPHVVTITDLNYTYGGSSLLTRNLTIDSIFAGGTTTTLNAAVSGSLAKSTYVTFPAAATITPVTLGIGPNTIKVGISEDAFMGDAQFTISVDGTQIGGIQTASAQHGSGQSQQYTLNGNFSDGSHTVAVTFRNPKWDSTYTRKLYVDSITSGGTTATLTGSIQFGSTLTYNSPVLWTASNPVSLGSGPDTIVVDTSENAWKGDAQFTISVDGKQIGGTQTTTAVQAAGQIQAFTLNGSFGPGTHVVTIKDLNYAWGGSSLLTRSLMIDSITAGGTTTTLNATVSGSLSSSTYVTLPAAATITPVTLGTGPSTIKVGISEDAFMGNAQFTISVDGTQIGGTQTATALHGAGQSQLYTLNGNFGGGSQTVKVNFLNQVSGTTSSAQRNLYVDTIATGSTVMASNSAITANGSQTFNVVIPTTAFTGVSLGTGSSSLTVNVSEDAYMGDAQFAVFVNGNQIGGTQTVSASHALGQSQPFTLHGSFGTGSEFVNIAFLNDANGGSPALDRNLYVDSVTANTVTTSEKVKLETTSLVSILLQPPSAVISAAVANATASPTLAFISASGAVPLDAGTGSTPLTLTASASRTAFILQEGAANGDIISNFKAGTAGDFLELNGYGLGATLTRLDATTWIAASDSGTIHDTIHIANGAAVVPTNYLFTS